MAITITVILIRASLGEVSKIATEKVQFFTLATHFFVHTPTYSLFYYLFSLNIILCGKESKRKKGRQK
jgi:hypothetical protein